MSSIYEQQKAADKFLDLIYVIDPYAIVAGGAPRDWYYGLSAKDIDVFMYPANKTQSVIELCLKKSGVIWKSRKAGRGLPEWYKLNPHIIAVYDVDYEGENFQIILQNQPTWGIVEKFPFSICQAWYKDRAIGTTALFDYTAKSRVIVRTNELYADHHAYVQKIKGKFPNFKFCKMVFDNASTCQSNMEKGNPYHNHDNLLDVYLAEERNMKSNPIDFMSW